MRGLHSSGSWAAAALLLFAAACSTAPRAVSKPAPPAAAAAKAAEQVMVTLEPAPPAIWERITAELEQAYRLRRVVAWTLTTVGEQCIIFDLPRGYAAQDMVRRLQADPRVVIAQPLQHFVTLAAGYSPPPVQLEHSALTLHLEQAHRWATGRGVRVAVIDTGVDLDHPDLRGRIVKANNFVAAARSFNDDIHGTAVAGIIAAHANHEIGLVSVAPNAEIFALKACWQEPPNSREAVCDSYTLALAIDYAVSQGAQILNFSLAGPEDPILAHLLEAAIKRGIVVVAAAAEDGRRPFPASLAGVIGVAGSNDLQTTARAARGLNRLVLAAPSVDILTTVPHGHYDFFSGSSLAAAQVSGVAALLLERDPRLTPSAIGALFHKTARPIPAATGGGRLEVEQVDACAALALALALNTGPCG